MAASTVGVGMGLRSRADGCLEVTEIVPNGPVDRSSRVKLGDVLKSVDGKDVDKTVSSARQLLLGPPGTTVRLELIRMEENAVGSAVAFFGFDAQQLQRTVVEVSVVRAACPPSTPQTPLSVRSVGQENISSNLSGSSPLGQPSFVSESPEWVSSMLIQQGKGHVVDDSCANLPEDSARILAERDMLQHENAKVRAERDALRAQLLGLGVDGSGPSSAAVMQERDALAARLKSAEERISAHRQQHEAAKMYSYHHQHLKTHIDESMVLIRAELETCQADLAACRTELECTKGELRQQLMNSQSDLTHLDEALAAKDSLERSLQHARAENASLLAKLEHLMAELDGSRASQASLLQEKTEVDAGLARAEQELRARELELEQHRHRLVRVEPQVAGALLHAESLRRQLFDVADALQVLVSSEEDEEEQEESHLEAVRWLHLQMAEREQEAVQMDIIISSLRTEADAAKAQLQESLADKARVQEQLRTVEREADGKQGELLERMEAQLSAKVAAVSAALQLDVEAARQRECEAVERLHRMQEQLATAPSHAALTELEEALAAATQESRRAREDLAAAVADKRAAAAALECAHQQLRAASEDTQRLQAVVGGVREIEGELLEAVGDVRALREVSETDVSRMEQCVAALQERLVKASEDSEATGDELEKVKAKLAAAQQLTADLTAKSASYVDALEQDKASLQGDKQALERQVADIQVQLQAARQTSWDAQAVQHRLTACEDERAAAVLEKQVMEHALSDQQAQARLLEDKNAKLAGQLQLLHQKTQVLLCETQRERDELTRALEEREREQARQAQRERDMMEAAQAALAAAKQQGAEEKQLRRSVEEAAAAQDKSAREAEAKLAASLGEQGALLKQLQEAQDMLQSAQEELAASCVMQQAAQEVAAGLDTAHSMCSRMEARLEEVGRRVEARLEQEGSAAVSARHLLLALEEQKEKVRREGAAAAADCEALRVRASVAEGKNAELEGKVREMEESSLAAEEERQALLVRWQSLQEHVEAAVAERTQLKATVADQQARLSHMKLEVEEANAALSTGAIQRQALAAELSVLQRQLQSEQETALTFEAQASKTEEAFLMQIKRAHDERDAAMTERDAALLERNAARADADQQNAHREGLEALNSQLTADKAALQDETRAALAELSEKKAELARLASEHSKAELELAAHSARRNELEERLAEAEAERGRGSGRLQTAVLVDGHTQTMTVDLTSGETWRKLEERERQLQVAEAQLKDARDRILALNAAAASERDSHKPEDAGGSKGKASASIEGAGDDGGGTEDESAVSGAGRGDAAAWREQQANLAQLLRAKDEAAEEMRRQLVILENKARGADEAEAEMERLKQRFNIKHKEQLEKTAQQRVKIAEEMRSAFVELQNRNERLSLSNKLVGVLDRQVAILTQELEANKIGLSAAARAQLAQMAQEETGVRAQCRELSVPLPPAHMHASHDARDHSAAAICGGPLAAPLPSADAACSPAPSAGAGGGGVGSRAPARGVLKRSSAQGDCASASSASSAVTQVATAPLGSDAGATRKPEAGRRNRVAFDIPPSAVAEPQPELPAPPARDGALPVAARSGEASSNASQAALAATAADPAQEVGGAAGVSAALVDDTVSL